MTAAGVRQSAPVAVHLRALKLVAPGAPAPAPEAVETVFRELDRMAAHLGLSAGEDRSAPAEASTRP